VLDAVRAHEEFLAAEVLARRVSLVDGVDGGFPGAVGDGLAVAVLVVKAD
jgi:isoleucyl-tRNA synthetase